MPRNKPIEKQELRVYEFGNKPLIYRRYENYVSCGVPTDVGDPSPEWWDILKSQGMEPESTLVVTAHGDSMMPDIGNGDIIFVDTATPPANGRKILVYVDDEALIKRYYYNPETRKVRLVPLNTKFQELELSKRSTRLRIGGVVRFSFRNQLDEPSITVGVTRGNKVAPPRKSKQPAPEPITIAAEPASQFSSLKPDTLKRLHSLIDGKKGKPVALAIYCAAQLGLITNTDYNAVYDEFGDIGCRQNYNRYFANPQRFSSIDIESTTNFLSATS